MICAYILEGTVWLLCWEQAAGDKEKQGHHLGGYCSNQGRAMMTQGGSITKVEENGGISGIF